MNPSEGVYADRTFSDELVWAEDLGDPRVVALRSHARAIADDLVADAVKERPELSEMVAAALDVGHMTHTVPVRAAEVWIEYSSTDTEVESATLVRSGLDGRVGVRVRHLLGVDVTGTIVGWMPCASGDRVAIVVRPPGSRLDTVHLLDWNGAVRGPVPDLYRSPVRFCPCGSHVFCVRASEGESPQLWRLGIEDAHDDAVIWDGLGPDFAYGMTIIGPDGTGYITAREADAPRNSIYSLALGEKCGTAVIETLPALPSLAAVQLGSDGEALARCPASADTELAVFSGATGQWVAITPPEGDGHVGGFAVCGQRLVVLRFGLAGTSVSIIGPKGAERSRYFAGITVDVYAPDPSQDRLSVLVQGWTVAPVSAAMSSDEVLGFLDQQVTGAHAIRCAVSEAVSADGRSVGFLDLAPTLTEATLPTIIWVYGGFGVLPRPSYSAAVHVWAGLGGRFVVPHVRGGGGGGRGWQEAGSGEGKLAACEDIVAVATRLVATGAADPARIVVQGGSHGGVLSSLTVLRNVDVFAGFIANKAPLDMVAVDRLAHGRLWRHEFPASQEVRVRLSALEELGAASAVPEGLLIYALDDAVVSAANASKFLALAARRGSRVAAVEHKNGGHIDRRSRGVRHAELLRILSFAWRARRKPSQV